MPWIPNNLSLLKQHGMGCNGTTITTRHSFISLSMCFMLLTAQKTVFVFDL